MLRLPTVSNLQRAMACAASTCLPLAPEKPPGAAAKRGTLIGRVIAARCLGKPDPDMGRYRLPLGWATMAELAIRIGPGDISCERAFSYDGAKVEVLGDDLGREYGRPGTICGAADIIALRQHAMVVDIKSGEIPAPEPVANYQLGALALFVSMAYEVETVTGAIAKINRDGSWDWSQHTWSLADLAAIRRRIDAARATWAEAHELEQSGWGATTAPGAHCRWCRCDCADNAFTKDEAA